MATIEEIRREWDALTQKLARPETIPGRDFARLSSRQAALRSILDLAERAELTRRQITEHEVASASADVDLRQITAEELPILRHRLRNLEQQLAEQLSPRDPHDARDAVLEIRAGTGGEEAALFARELFGMYTKYADHHGWTLSLVSESRSDLGGYKEVIAEVRAPRTTMGTGQGAGPYGILRLESGVHRVQRIPATEKSGRIHTSTATVAVLPTAEPEDVEIRPQDLRIDTFRAGGHGGQHVQKTESAVRITHLPTGLVVSCQDERSQHANKERALAVLRSRLLAAQEAKKQVEERGMRRKQIGTGDRTEKIRTYNVPQDRVTDHRIKETWHGIDRILGGGLDAMIEALQKATGTGRQS